MGIISRARDIMAASFGEPTGRSDDPARMIRLIIDEMEETLVEVRAAAARAIADSKDIGRTIERLGAIQQGWSDKAELALSKGREDLARAALVERQKAADMAAGLTREVAAIDSALDGYRSDIATLQGKLREARSRQNLIASRIEGAATRARANALLHGERTADAFARFDQLERRADLAEGEAEALGLTAPDSLDRQLAGRRSASSVEAELQALKAALARKGNGDA